MQSIIIGQSASSQGPVKASSVEASRAQPHLGWAAAKVLWRVTKGVCATTALGIAGLVATAELGSIQGLMGAISPAAVIASAPAGIGWVKAPSSPMVEAGRTAEGGLDVRQMMLAWQDAGMESTDARKAMALVSQMRPLLMGRDDPLARVEQTALASQAARQLALDFPVVAENLKNGVSSPSAKQWDVAAWPSIIDDIEMSLAHDTHLRLLDQPPSLSGNTAKRNLWQAAQDKPVQALPTLIQLVQSSGPVSSGSMDVSDGLLDALQRAGIPAYIAQGVHEVMILSTTPVQGLPKKMVDEHIEHTQNVDDEMAYILGDGGWDRVVQAISDPSFVSPLASPDNNPQEWAEIKKEIRAQELAARTTDPVKPVSMEEAMKALEGAVQDTGLRSLSPSLWQMRSPASVMELAQNLQRANAELAHATGWSGKVLGLDGRVELSMGPIMQRSEDLKSAVAAVAADESGRLQMISGWAEMGHEWFHAFDHVAARYSLQNPSQRPLTENVQLLRRTNSPDIKQAVRSLNEILSDGSPEWQKHREQANDLRDTNYYTRGTEVGAYAFGAYLDNSGAELLASSFSKNDYTLDLQVRPNKQEQGLHASYFQEVFAAAAQLNLSGMNSNATPKMKPIASWRSARPTVDTLNNNRRPALR